MADKDPILDLATLSESRPPIRIDGVTYHLKSPDELTLAESHRFAAWGGRVQELGGKVEHVDELQKLIAEVSWAALADVPVDVFARLSPTQHMAIVEVFTALLLELKARRVGATLGAVRSSGASSFRASSAAMAATPGGGSTPRPPVSSGSL